MSRIYDAIKRAQSERAGNKDTEGHSEFERRRAERVALRVPVFVYGHGLRNEPFHEESSSINVNHHGALLALSRKVKSGQELLLTNPATHSEQSCRVIFFKQKKQKRIVEVGVAFSEPAPNFWGMPGETSDTETNAG